MPAEDEKNGQLIEVESAEVLSVGTWWRVREGQFDRLMLNGGRTGVISTYGEIYNMNGGVLNVVAIRDFRHSAGQEGTTICFKLYIEDSQGLRPGNYFIPRGTVTLAPYEGEVPEE